MTGWIAAIRRTFDPTYWFKRGWDAHEEYTFELIRGIRKQSEPITTSEQMHEFFASLTKE